MTTILTVRLICFILIVAVRQGRLVKTRRWDTRPSCNKASDYPAAHCTRRPPDRVGSEGFNLKSFRRMLGIGW